MKKSCGNIHRDISRFVDKELSREQYQKLAQHLSNCPDCNLLVEQYKTLSNIFNEHADQIRLKLNTDKLKHKSGFITQDLSKKSWSNIYLKLASITAILVISLVALQGDVFRSKEPSAIVTSVNTDFSSVMIIETQKEKHTIIWFSET